MKIVTSNGSPLTMSTNALKGILTYLFPYVIIKPIITPRMVPSTMAPSDTNIVLLKPSIIIDLEFHILSQNEMLVFMFINIHNLHYYLISHFCSRRPKPFAIKKLVTTYRKAAAIQTSKVLKDSTFNLLVI